MTDPVYSNNVLLPAGFRARALLGVAPGLELESSCPTSTILSTILNLIPDTRKVLSKHAITPHIWPSPAFRRFSQPVAPTYFHSLRLVCQGSPDKLSTANDLL